MSNLLKNILLFLFATQTLFALDLSKPTISYESHTIGEASSKQLPVELHFLVDNPNPMGIKNVKVNSEYFFEGKRFLSSKESIITLKANAKTKITIKADLVYADIIHSGASIAKKVLNGDKTIPIEVKVRLHGNPTLSTKFGVAIKLPFDQSIKQTIHIPISQDSVKKAISNPSEALESFKGLF